MVNYSEIFYNIKLNGVIDLNELAQISKVKLICELFTGIGYFLFAIVMFSMISGAATAITLVLMFLSLTLVIISYYSFRPLAIKFKDQYVNQALKELGIEATYNAKYGMTKDDASESGVIQFQSKYSSEDLVEGIIDQKRFRFSDVHVQKRVKTGKSTTYITTFKGRLYQFESDKIAKVPVYIYPNRRKYLPMFSSEKKVELESINFNNTFDVYSTDEHTAFYVITPKLIEKIQELNKKYDKLAISYKGNQLYVSVDTRIDYFKVSLFHPIEATFLTDFKQDILEIREIIKTLS